MKIVELERLCHDDTICQAAYVASAGLIEKGFMNWNAACWDEPAVAVMDGEKCVAGINYSVDEKQRTASVEFAFCDKGSPAAFAMCLLRVRKRAREAKVREVRFGIHAGNKPMEKLVGKLGLTPKMLSFRVPVPAAA